MYSREGRLYRGDQRDAIIRHGLVVKDRLGEHEGESRDAHP